MRPFAGLSSCCGAVRHFRHSLQLRILSTPERQQCGKPLFGKSELMSGFDGITAEDFNAINFRHVELLDCIKNVEDEIAGP